jgi:hypothetical protein
MPADASAVASNVNAHNLSTTKVRTDSTVARIRRHQRIGDNAGVTIDRRYLLAVARLPRCVFGMQLHKARRRA